MEDNFTIEMQRKSGKKEFVNSQECRQAFL